MTSREISLPHPGMYVYYNAANCGDPSMNHTFPTCLFGRVKSSSYDEAKRIKVEVEWEGVLAIVPDGDLMAAFGSVMQNLPVETKGLSDVEIFNARLEACEFLAPIAAYACQRIDVKTLRFDADLYAATNYKALTSVIDTDAASYMDMCLGKEQMLFTDFIFETNNDLIALSKKDSEHPFLSFGTNLVRGAVEDFIYKTLEGVTDFKTYVIDTMSNFLKAANVLKSISVFSDEEEKPVIH